MLALRHRFLASSMTQVVPQVKLYDRDFVAWCDHTVAQLKAGQLSEIDLDNLIEEIEGLAGRDRRELASRLEVLLSHLIKRCYLALPENDRGWELTIREQRRELRILLKQSPSLRPYLAQIFDETWDVALSELRQDYPTAQLPKTWPCSREIEDLLSETFWQ